MYCFIVYSRTFLYASFESARATPSPLLTMVTSISSPDLLELAREVWTCSLEGAVSEGASNLVS